MSIAKELINKQQKLESERLTFEQHWAEIAPLVLPRQDDFFGENRQPGERRTREKFDDTATLALVRGSAAIESILAPRGSIWSKIALPEQLDQDQEAQEWADRLNRFLFSKRYRSEANFASQFHEVIMSLLAFGTGVMIVEDIPGSGARYKASHISEHYIMENIHGMIDTDYRKYKLTAAQAVQKFKEKTPSKVLDIVEKEPNKKIEFLHAVIPDDDGETGMPFKGFHIHMDSAELIGVGGFRSMPYIVSRWNTSPCEVYGRSPAMESLSEIKMLNAMRKTDLKARHMAVDPPILAADQHTVRRMSMRPGKINYGTLDVNGNALVRPYRGDVNVPASNDGIQNSREFINNAFFVTLFQILVETPTMTATEVLERSQEKGALLSPTAGRQHTELLDRIIEREIGIYDVSGVFEDGQILEPPESVKEIGGQFEVEYVNPLTKMQKSEEAISVQRTIESLLPFAESGILSKIDFDTYAEIMRKANGAPAKLFKTPDELQAELEAKQQQEAIQQVIEQAAPVAGAVKDIAQAQQISEG